MAPAVGLSFWELQCCRLHVFQHTTATALLNLSDFNDGVFALKTILKYVSEWGPSYGETYSHSTTSNHQKNHFPNAVFDLC